MIGLIAELRKSEIKMTNELIKVLESMGEILQKQDTKNKLFAKAILDSKRKGGLDKQTIKKLKKLG